MVPISQTYIKGLHRLRNLQYFELAGNMNINSSVDLVNQKEYARISCVTP